MKKCAFLTLDERGDYVIDDEHAVAPLADRGWQVSTVSWRQTEIPWSGFDAVIIRSTWDYWNDVTAFLEVLSRIDRETHLANSLEIVHWNLEKTYLADLDRQGVRIVPTIWPLEVKPDSFQAFSAQLGGDQLVIKPVIGANGDRAFRVSPDDSRERREMISACFADRRALVQKFMPGILTEGEFSLFFFNGEFSHAILKTPAENEFRSQEERGASIRSVTPEPQLLARGHQALAALPEMPLYARADFVRDDESDFLVMELELIEPSMYLRTDPGAPVKFARAIDARYGAAGKDAVTPVKN
jgi:glutathione synthase/RimK-type ligase-like ATP-grasp enzyme